MSVAVALVFGLSAFFGVVPIVNMLSGANSSAGMMNMGSRYLQGLSFGIPANITALILMPFMQLDGDQSRAVKSIVVMTAVDIVGDCLVAFVFD